MARARQLKGMDVIAVSHARKLGTVDEIYLDVTDQRAVGLRVNEPGLFSGHKVATWPDIKSIGSNAVTVESPSDLKDLKDVPQLQDASTASNMDGDRIMTESGTDVGRVGDIEIDASTGKITAYILREGFLQSLQHREQLIPSSWVRSIGNHIIVVADRASTTAGS